MIITLGGNLVLALAKGFVAWVSGSAAVYSDAANSVSDVIYSLLMVLGLWVATRPPDLSHPQGHERFEPLVGLAVSIAMAFAGYEAARNALERYREASLAPITLDLPTLVLLASAAIKGGMFVWIRRIGAQLHSPTLTTSARDNLSDVLTSIAAFLGVLGSNLIHPLADPIAGFVVAAWIFRQVYIAARENLGFLTGKGVSEEELKTLASAAAEVPGVIKVHHIITDYVGPRLMVDLHINVDGNITVHQAHEISDNVTRTLESMPQVDRAYVHIEPHDWVD
jgi:cation diffusion facilitator family transporter